MAWTNPRTWVAGETLTAALLNVHLRDNLNALGDPWTAYTPTLTGWAIGNGTLVARYMATGKLIHAYIKITAGSTTTYGTLGVSLPVASRVGAWFPAGLIVCKDDAATNPRTVSAVLTSTTAVAGFQEAGAAAPTATVPFTFGAADTVEFVLTYEAA